MTTQEVKRKLTAILSADVKGYRRLMGEDEVATLKTLSAYFQIMATLIQKHQGKVLNIAGDNLLADFESVVDAVQCGVEIQKELRTKNAELAEGRRVEFRIGVNLGDVIREGDTIYGDGVNIAERVQSLADAGGICISGTAFDHVRNKLDLGYKYLGEQTVKNITLPVRVYKVLMEPEAAGKVIGEKKVKPRQWKNAAIGLVVVVIVVIAAAVIWKFYSPTAPKTEVATKEKMAFPLPDVPSIAVLPFVNMSGDPKQEFLSDGISEEIITALSKIRALFVISRQSTFSYKGKPVKVKQVSEELGVRYVLEGSVQRSADRIRITAQLVDALTGRHIWAERYDRPITDLFALQDEITMKILTAIQVKLTEGEQASTEFGKYRGKLGLDCHLKILEGYKYFHGWNIESTRVARRIAEEAMTMCPEAPGAYVLMGWVHYMEYWMGIGKSPQESIEKGIELAQKALAMDDSIAAAHGLLCLLYGFKRECDKSIAEGERAVALDPGGTFAHQYYAASLMYSGRPEEAIPVYQKAIRLDPVGSTTLYHAFGNALRMSGRFEEAVSACKKALQLAPDSIQGHILLTLTYSLMGREEEARIEAAEVLRINPKFSVDNFAKRLPYKDRSETDKVINGLRKAGLK
jgi:adenylate cyclase